MTTHVGHTPYRRSIVTWPLDVPIALTFRSGWRSKFSHSHQAFLPILEAKVQDLNCFQPVPAQPGQHNTRCEIFPSSKRKVVISKVNPVLQSTLHLWLSIVGLIFHKSGESRTEGLFLCLKIFWIFHSSKNPLFWIADRLVISAYVQY